MNYTLLFAAFYIATAIALFFAATAFWFWSLNQIDADTIAGQSNTIRTLRAKLEASETLCRAQERCLAARDRGERLQTEIENTTTMFTKPSTN